MIEKLLEKRLFICKKKDYRLAAFDELQKILCRMYRGKSRLGKFGTTLLCGNWFLYPSAQDSRSSLAV